jgi:DNA-binding transcriptional ArsR family regulator
MPSPSARSDIRLTDPSALRGLAHPTRLALVGLLRQEGPLTATRAAELLGESSGSTSFHLRQLAKYGLVEEAGGGRGRERPWRATSMYTSWDTAGGGPETAAAAELLTGVVTDRYRSDLLRWRDARAGEPQEWRDAAEFGDTFLFVTAAELREIAGKVKDLLDPYLDRTVQPELRPPGARPVVYLRIAHPLIGPAADSQDL